MRSASCSSRNGLGEYVDTGVQIDGLISVDFLMSIFYPSSPLHDGAVVVRGDRVVAAACLMPLTETSLTDQHLGTRHRAGVGITERTDAISVIVSESPGSSLSPTAGASFAIWMSRS